MKSHCPTEILELARKRLLEFEDGNNPRGWRRVVSWIKGDMVFPSGRVEFVEIAHFQKCDLAQIAIEGPILGSWLASLTSHGYILRL